MKLRNLIVLASLILSCISAFADDQKESKAVPKVTNELYRTNCGTCHFAYQPGLLPAKSWQKIIDVPGAHPGGDFSVEKKTKDEIRKYLTQNSAENTGAKRSRKILASIGSDVPTRISRGAIYQAKTS